MKNIGRLFTIQLAMLWLFTGSTAHAQTGVTVEVDQFGVGSYYRAGDLTGVRLKLTSNLAQPTPVWVQWQVPNADGDIAEYGRSLTLTPQQPALSWLYAPLSPDVNPSSVWTVRVFEERDGQRRAEIGGTRISPAGATYAEISTSLIAVVGQSRQGLDGYTTPGGAIMRTNRPPGAHEDTRIASGIRPSQLPDRWYGLLPFEALVWSGGDSSSPREMGLDQAEAVREYVRRGGHLIISLPSAGNVWGLGMIGQTELEDLLPCRRANAMPRKDDAVKLSTLLPIMSKYNDVKRLIGNRQEPEYSIRVFKDLKGDFDVIDNHYEPLIALADGRIVVIQRHFGFGRITVIGLDLSEARLTTALGLPQPDAFWNRILGRRSEAPTAAELKAIDDAKRLARADIVHENGLGMGPLVTTVTNMEAQAGKGLLLAMLLFMVYWVLAGPGGFWLLKHYGKVQHAWLAFAACAAFFTVIAWGGANLFPKRITISHVTVLDHIARPADDPRPNEPQYQRAVSFFSAYMPDYGSTPISISSLPEQRDVLLSWTPPGPPPMKFPNVDRYRVDVARGMANVALPSRSTATSLYANWLGGLDRNWGGTLLVDPNNPIRVQTIGDSEQSLTGAIKSELPGTLRNVTLIWVKSNRTVRRRYALEAGQDQPWVAGLSGGPMNTIEMWRLAATDDLEPGNWLNFSSLRTGDMFVNTIQRRYIDPYAKRDAAAALGATTVAESDRRNYMEILSLFNQVNPPEYLKSPDTTDRTDGVAFHRHLGRELDLSPWLTRPCLIIMGFLDNVPSPVPLRIDGSEEFEPAKSLTMVRWVYPLPLNEKIAFKEVFEQSE